MDNASVILQTFDRHLTHPARLILYGRAALQLGFEDAPPETANSKDVDAIVPLDEAEALSEDDSFWDAQEATNLELRPKGLYITHLFRSDQLFLRRDWKAHLIAISRPRLQRLSLFRPATLDLILTKMMRGDDPQDMADAQFMIRHDRIAEPQLLEAFLQMNPIELVELRDAFDRAKPVIIDLARKAAATA